MRFSTVASFLVAIILAGLAVYGVQNFLNAERAQVAASMQQQTVEKKDETSGQTIVVANKVISFGERIDKSTVREIKWSGEITPAGSFARIEDLVVGDTEETARFALTSIAIGEPILTSKVTDPGQRAKLSTALSPGMKAVSIRVNDVLGVAGFVLPGDRVDVMLLRQGYVDVLLQGVKVLAIDQSSDDRKDKPSVVRTVTFEVNTLEAQKLALASNVGTLSLALRNVASTDYENIERVTLSDLNEIDVAEDLLEAKQEEAASEAADERIDNLEALLKNIAGGMKDVEEKINTQEPFIIEKEVVKEVIVEKLINQAPVRSKVGVIRNGKRSEYKVDQNDGEEAESEGDPVEEPVSVE
ncbi:Flp pilus assembly protein CpaB [Roseovarius sp.]|uniref:Flp pilus assembly protein CpaB n=1 Tax=Roseovarius sp. TaxID=1486281 RepID=UPI003A96AA29